MINESIVDYDYPRDNITWVMELRRVIQRILDIDPSWKLTNTSTFCECYSVLDMFIIAVNMDNIWCYYMLFK